MIPKPYPLADIKENPDLADKAIRRTCHHRIGNMEVRDLISQYLDDAITLSSKATADISAATEAVSFRKGETIMEVGEQHPYFYYLQAGGVRSYYLGNGIEIVNWFALESEWFGSIQTFMGAPSRDSIDCIEDCRCLRFDISTFIVLQRADVAIANFVNVLAKECAIFLENRLRQIQYKEAMDRYLYIVEHKPEYLQRIPLTYLASYLGISRETLSRIRKQVVL